MRTVFTFRSSQFNTSSSREYFINPECFGDDVARWLIAALTAKDLRADSEPGQEDFGWYFNFDVPEGRHCCVIGYRPEEDGAPGVWIGWIERQAGFVGSLLGGGNRQIAIAATEALHKVLTEGAPIHDVTWHDRKDFDAGREELGASSPNAE